MGNTSENNPRAAQTLPRFLSAVPPKIEKLYDNSSTVVEYPEPHRVSLSSPLGFKFDHGAPVCISFNRLHAEIAGDLNQPQVDMSNVSKQQLQ